MAEGAVASLLGRLTALLIDEAQLLSGVRGEVEFIKEEMESMNSLLLHLTEAQHRAHHVRTWMKQVVRLARDCEAYVELYVQSIRFGVASPGASKGLLGYVRRILGLLRTIPARHRVATRIRELKVRARDVGDRRLRYGVTVPLAADQDSATFQTSPAPGGSGGGEEDARRRTLLGVAHGGVLDDDDDKTRVNNGIDRLVEWLSEDAAESRPRVFSILWKHRERPYEEEDDEGQCESSLELDPEECEEVLLSSYDDTNNNDDSGSESSSRRSLELDDIKRESALAACIARGVYQHPSVVSSFGCKAWTKVTHSYDCMKPQGLLLREILEQVVGQEDELRTMSTEAKKSQGGEQDEAAQLAIELQGYLKGKRFLIVLEDVPWPIAWDSIRSAILHDCAPGSAIIMTTSSDVVAGSSPPYKIFRAQSLYAVFCNKAEELIDGSEYCSMDYIETILEHCYPDAFAMKMVLHLLYVNPNKTEDELRKIMESLSECKRLNRSIAKQMLMFCYQELPSKYRSCLLFLSIFPKNHIIRRTSLARKWIAEGLITAIKFNDGAAIDEAECCFDMLVTRGFILPWKFSSACNIKSFTVHHEVREFITRIAADVSFVDTNLPPDLAHHLSIHNRIGLQASDSNHPVEADGNGIAAFLPYLAKSSQWQLLKVLDLEGCKGLKKKHLKNICKILLLKYLSLRNTDVTEIPKQIEKLQCLETLDIRQTALRALATKSVMLPMLKHLFAGRTDSPSDSSERFHESFATVCLPSGIRRMKNLEIMSHVEVSDNFDDLTDVGQLLHLRKLGVILHSKNGGLGLFFQQIEKLYGCLRSLSIRINQPVTSEGADADEVVALVSPPKLVLESLNISGITSGLPLWIAELNQLVKITLSETYLGEDALGIMGKLRILSCLRLRRKSYTRSELNFKKNEFKSLKSLVIEGSDITNITFDAGAATKLEMIAWTFAKMESISGVVHLPRLTKLELNGDCNPDRVRQAIKQHPNHPVFKHNPQHQRQEAETVIAASTP